MKKLAVLGILLSAHLSQARQQLGFELEVGQGYLAETLTYGWRPVKPEGASDGIHIARAGLSAGANQTKTEDSTTGATQTLRGRDFSANLGFEWREEWRADFSVASSTTPESKYIQSNANVLFLYQDKAWGLGLGGGSGRVRQKVSIQVLNTNVERDVDLDQRELRLTANWSPRDILQFTLDLKSYSYSKSKDELQRAYGSRFLNYYTTDLVSNLGGLPESSASLDAFWMIDDFWDLDIYFQAKRLIVDDSQSRKLLTQLSHHFETMSVGLGVSRSETAQLVDSSLLVNINLEFN